jgi:hypothetical protein
LDQSDWWPWTWTASECTPYCDGWKIPSKARDSEWVRRGIGIGIGSCGCAEEEEEGDEGGGGGGGRGGEAADNEDSKSGDDESCVGGSGWRSAISGVVVKRVGGVVVVAGDGVEGGSGSIINM